MRTVINALSALSLLAGSLQAGSTLNFPRLSEEANTFTGVAIVNPTDADAAVTLTAYGTDGTLLTGITNPAQITVPANQQLARLTVELFGSGLDPSTAGWFQATSETDDLTGFFLFLNAAGTEFDGADLPESAASIIFNQVWVDATRTTELNIINTGDSQAGVQVDLVETTGTTTRNVTLAARAMTRLDAGAFFEVTDTQVGAYVRITSDGSVAGFEFIQDSTGDLLGLNAQPSSQQLQNLFFPQMAVLGPWKTELGLVNYSEQAVVVTISAHQADGTLYGGADLQQNPVVQALNASQSLLLDVETVFGFSGTETRDGWIRVESTSEALNGYVSYGVKEAGSIASVAASGGGQKRAVFSHIATVGGFFTGVAVLNSGQMATGVRVLAIEPEGTVLGSFSTVLQPGERISKLINEMIPEAAGQGGGLIWVKSDLPVHSTSLFGTASVLANIPPQAAPDGYNPDAGIPSLAIDPPLAIVQPGAEQTFTASGATGAVDWKVNNISLGDATTGTITSEGVYTAPAEVPESVVTVSAEVDGQAAGASVDVLEKKAVFTAQTFLQSVAYLDSLQKLYTAELTLLTASGTEPASVGPLQGETDSDLIEWLPDGSRTTLRTFSGEKIAKMISYASSTGKEFLLLAAESSGEVLRYDPETGSGKTVASDLNQPSALVYDEESETLFVAEQDKVSTVSRLQLEVGLTARLPGPSQPRHFELFPVERADGIAVDRCTGNVFVSNRQSGEILEYVASTGETRTLITGFTNPTRLLANYRSGVSCPDSLHLLAIDPGRDRVFLITPTDKRSRAWADARQSTDLTFLGAGNPFVLDRAEAVVLAEELEAAEDQFQISAVPVANLYSPQPVNTPPKPEPDVTLGDTVNFSMDFSRSYIIVCDLGTESGSETASIQFDGTLGQKSGRPVITGTFTGDFQSSEPDEPEDCTLRGDFEVGVAPAQATEPLTDLSGTWEGKMEGISHCVGDIESDDDLFTFPFSVEITQSGSEFSGSFLARIDEDEEADLTCSQPGQCTFQDSQFGFCSVTCEPATEGCQILFLISGTVTPAEE